MLSVHFAGTHRLTASELSMHADLDADIPNDARGVVTTNEIVALISSG
jgi:hypothetical protein